MVENFQVICTIRCSAQKSCLFFLLMWLLQREVELKPVLTELSLPNFNDFFYLLGFSAFEISISGHFYGILWCRFFFSPAF